MTASDAATDLADAQRRDAADPLAALAAEFHVPRGADGSPVLYLCGHSLGLQPKSVAAHVDRELAQWRDLAVSGHHDAAHPWIPYHEHAAAGLARLVGALPAEVVAMNSLTVNLHLMLTTFFRPAGARNRIMMESGAFGSDRYAVVSHLRLHGLDEAQHLIELAPRPGESLLRGEDIIAAIEREGARLSIALLPGVQFLTGQAFDIEAIVAAAHAQGSLAGIDLAHSIGNMPLKLHDWGADFAVWCSYKYLNAGPGAVGGCFVHERYAHDFELPRLAGWWGHDKTTRFEMGPEFRPLAGAEGWQVSNPPILATAPLLASLEIFMRAGIVELRNKSIALTGYLQQLIESQLAGRALIVTPRDPAQRGCQLSLRIDGGRGAACIPAGHGDELASRLEAAGVIGDWREPDVLRLAPIPSYNSFVQIFEAVRRLRRALDP